LHERDPSLPAKNRFYESTQRLIQPRRVLWLSPPFLRGPSYEQRCFQPSDGWTTVRFLELEMLEFLVIEKSPVTLVARVFVTEKIESRFIRHAYGVIWSGWALTPKEIRKAKPRIEIRKALSH
jgi:hypothetical protein